MITFDWETKSYADLLKVGAWAYSEDPTTDIICAAYKIGGRPIQDWCLGLGSEHSMPRDLANAIRSGEPVEAHNVAFEYAIWHNVAAKKYGWFLPAEDQWRDSMATAAYYSMPMALDRLSRALGRGGKNPDGTRLISKYSKLHLKTALTTIPREDLLKFVSYCRDDVAEEHAVSEYLGDLPDTEQAVFQLDQEINRRGMYLDLEGIENATAIVDQRSDELAAKFRDITGLDHGQNAKVREWFAAQGFFLENMQKDYLKDVLENMPQGVCRDAIEIKLQVSKASTKKLDAMARQRGLDGRARFQTRYHGAGTGRWTGSGFQPLNLARGFEDVDPELLVSAISHRDPALLDALYGDAMDAVSKASRHWIQAQAGNRILAGDFVSIEAIILAVLAGEDWKVEAFANGVKIYEHMGDQIYGLPPGTVTKKTHPAERQDGKVGELAFGYQGALGAWLNFDRSGRHTDERIIEICKAWRGVHPMTVRMWYGMDAACKEAVEFPGRETSYRDIGFKIIDAWLAMMLPNGKRLWYFHPQLRTKMPRWHQPLAKEDCAAGTCDCKPGVEVTYMSQKEGQWKRVNTYGGKLTENAVQAVSRELLVPSMLRVRAAGYPIIMSVYDEIVCEMPNGQGSKQELKQLLEILPDWAAGWPVTAEVWEGERYKK